MSANRLPEPLRQLVDQLAALPGLGPKSALRMALTILKWPEARALQLGQSILDLRAKLALCDRCGSLTDRQPCALCADAGRNPALLCLVSEWDSLLAMEQGGFYRGYYMLLGGLLSPLDGTDSDALDLERLRKRLAEGRGDGHEGGTVQEIILALGTTLEAENTSSYVKNLVEREFPGIRVTRLAQGIPLGQEVKFVDKETLKQSLMHRQSL